MILRDRCLLAKFDRSESDQERVRDSTLPHGLTNLTESIDQDLPISVQKPTWSLLENPNRIFRNFKFDNIKSLEDFTMELISYQESVGHHAKIIIENLNIGIETHTHNLNEVTELDLELAKFCDLLYEDVKHYYSRDEEDQSL